MAPYQPPQQQERSQKLVFEELLVKILCKTNLFWPVSLLAHLGSHSLSGTTLGA